MANKVVLTKLLDGPRHVIMHLYLESDGASGEITDLVVVDPTQVIPSLSAVPGLTIEKVLPSLNGFAVKIEFDSVTDTPVWVLTEHDTDTVCFDCFGGLKDRSNPLDGSGKLLISTVGFTSIGDMGSIIFQVRKD